MDEPSGLAAGVRGVLPSSGVAYRRTFLTAVAAAWVSPQSAAYPCTPSVSLDLWQRHRSPISGGEFGVEPKHDSSNASSTSSPPDCPSTAYGCR